MYMYNYENLLANMSLLIHLMNNQIIFITFNSYKTYIHCYIKIKYAQCYFDPYLKVMYAKCDFGVFASMGNVLFE
jgi:hypothetical protein